MEASSRQLIGQKRRDKMGRKSRKKLCLPKKGIRNKGTDNVPACRKRTTESRISRDLQYTAFAVIMPLKEDGIPFASKQMIKNDVSLTKEQKERFCRAYTRGTQLVVSWCQKELQKGGKEVDQ
eukprot:1177409-Prorocentrum_minimum.AAC.1